MSHAKIIPITGIPVSTTASSLTTITPQSPVGEPDSSSTAPVYVAEGPNETRPTTHSYRAWMTNLPQRTRTTVEIRVESNKTEEVKAMTQHRQKSPLSKEVLMGDDLEENRQDRGGQPNEAESNVGADTTSPSLSQDKMRDKGRDKLDVAQMDTGEKTFTVPTPAVPATVSTTQSQPSESLYHHNAQAFLSTTGVQPVSPPAPARHDSSRSIESHHPSKAPLKKISDRHEVKHAPELGSLDFSFDKDGPSLDFHLDFDVKLGLEIKTIAMGEVSADKAVSKSSKPVAFLETLSYTSPTIMKYAPKAMRLKLSQSVAFASPEPSNKDAGEDVGERKCNPNVHTPKLYVPKASSSHSSSGSNSSSVSMLSWLLIREPLTPRFNHLRAVLEGNTKEPEEALPQWPPGTKNDPCG
jgi:hypothetical protein